MFQALIRKGSVTIEDIPAPIVSKGRVLIRVVNSCISAGTEVSGVASTGKSIVTTILEQPEKVQKFLNMIRSEGLAKSLDQYNYLKNSGQPTGYSVSGIVIAVADDVSEFKPGDRVAAAGGGFAFHAEFVEVPKNLVVSIPSTLDFRYASTIALGAIALHGVRRLNSQIGEFGVVTGAGILGLLSVQILAKSGIRVIAIDVKADRLEIASELGAEFVINSSTEDPVKSVQNITRGVGADAVLFAAATSDSKPISQAFQMCRRKGHVVLMGVSGMELDRKDLYAKEIDLITSTSYGPGRYDKNYEEEGVDYPLEYVRWTERRNFSEYIRLLNDRQILLDKLINKIFPIEEAGAAFESLKSQGSKPLMVLLDYGIPKDFCENQIERKIFISTKTTPDNIINVGILGVGNFAQSVHLPNLKRLYGKFNIYAIGSQSGVKARNAGVFYNAKYVTTQYEEIINDPAIDLIMICTRHGNHASLALQALKAGKHVFVEKPLATTLEDLNKIEEFFRNKQEGFPLLMVGFNRRFSPYINEIKRHTDRRTGPLFIQYRMNAGYQPADHWTHKDGGRITGEACHIVDLSNALTGSTITEVHFQNIADHKGKFLSDDNKSIILKYSDGSVTVLNYFALGSKELAKEYMEVHFDEKSIIMNDYRQLNSFGFKIKPVHSKKSQKGHFEELISLYNSIHTAGAPWPIPLEDMLQTTKVLLSE